MEHRKRKRPKVSSGKSLKDRMRALGLKGSHMATLLDLSQWSISRKLSDDIGPPAVEALIVALELLEKAGQLEAYYEAYGIKPMASYKPGPKPVILRPEEKTATAAIEKLQSFRCERYKYGGLILIGEDKSGILEIFINGEGDLILSSWRPNEKNEVDEFYKDLKIAFDVIKDYQESYAEEDNGTLEIIEAELEDQADHPEHLPIEGLGAAVRWLICLEKKLLKGDEDHPFIDRCDVGLDALRRCQEIIKSI